MLGIAEACGGSIPVSRRRWTISESGLATVDAPPVRIAASIKRSACPCALIRTATPLHTAPRECETHITRDHNFGVGQPLLFHQGIESCSVGRFESHAAVGCRCAAPARAEIRL